MGQSGGGGAGQAFRAKAGSSRASDPATAVAELAAALHQPEIGLLIVFLSSRYDLAAVAAEFSRQFGDVPAIGCTTAGGIGPQGYIDQGMAGVSIAAGDLSFEVAALENVSGSDLRRAQKFAAGLRERARRLAPDADAERYFAFMLIDGLCGREESVARAFHDGLGGIPLLGGSAGDDLVFARTFVFLNGRFLNDAAVLLVGTSRHPFTVFKTQHFVCGDERMVVTRANPGERTVMEINGCPAAEEYARAVALAIDDLDPMVFAACPVVVRIGDSDFVRSIQRVNPDGSLTFFCAIDEGIVFRVAKGVGLVENLRDTLSEVRTRIGEPRLILGCDCILRNLEARRSGLRDTLGELLAGCRVVGFSTYGEQFRGMHVNQTLTGIAFGDGAPR